MNLILNRGIYYVNYCIITCYDYFISKYQNNALKMWMAEHYCIVPTNEDEAKYMSKYFSNSIAKIKNWWKNL